MFAIGLAGLVVGSVALALSQPYAVYYPLLLIGLICTILPASLFGRVRQRYAEIDLRRMKARDII